MRWARAKSCSRRMRRCIEAIGRFHVTFLTSVPTMLALIVRETETLARTDLSSVRAVRMGSAPTTQQLIDAVKKAFPGAAVSYIYGTTEAGPVMFGAHPDGRQHDRLSQPSREDPRGPDA